MFWNIEKSVIYDGCNDKFKLNKDESAIIGYNNDFVIDIMIKPSYSKLSYIELLKEIIINRFIIHNPSKNKNVDNKDQQRYLGKKLITYVLFIESNTYIEYDWDWDKTETKSLIIDAMMSHYENEHINVFTIM